MVHMSDVAARLGGPHMKGRLTMGVSYVERADADDATKAFYDRAEGTFEMVLNIFKVFGHTPELGAIFTDSVMAMLKDAKLEWKTKELLILKATHRNECQYCVVQHEAVSQRVGVTPAQIADLAGDRYKSSDLFTDGEKALLDLTVQIGADANRVSRDTWDRVKAHYTEPQIVEAAYVITQYIAISKFGDALGVGLEDVFLGGKPILEVAHHGS